MHIVIAGTPALTNLGDQAIILCMMQDMRNVFGEDTTFTLLSHYPEIALKRVGHLSYVRDILPIVKPGLRKHPNWKISTLTAGAFLQGRKTPLRPLFGKNPAADAIESADLLAFAGGRQYASPYYDAVLEGWMNATLAQRCGIPVVMWSQSIGPFNTVKEKAVAGGMLGACNLICARDTKTHQFLQAFGLPGTRIERTADCVFNLMPSSDAEVDAAMQQARITRGERPLVAVTARTMKHTISGYAGNDESRYEHEMASLLDGLSNEVDLVFLSSTYRDGTYDRHDPDVGRAIQRQMQHGDRLQIVDQEFPCAYTQGHVRADGCPSEHANAPADLHLCPRRACCRARV